MNRTADLPLSIDDVDRAAMGLRDVVFRRPLLEKADANAALGGRLLMKAECAQRTGAFKYRGAYNCIRQLTAAGRSRR